MEHENFRKLAEPQNSRPPCCPTIALLNLSGAGADSTWNILSLTTLETFAKKTLKKKRNFFFLAKMTQMIRLAKEFFETFAREVPSTLCVLTVTNISVRDQYLVK